MAQPSVRQVLPCRVPVRKGTRGTWPGVLAALGSLGTVGGSHGWAQSCSQHMVQRTSKGSNLTKQQLFRKAYSGQAQRTSWGKGSFGCQPHRPDSCFAICHGAVPFWTVFAWFSVLMPLPTSLGLFWAVWVSRSRILFSS